MSQDSINQFNDTRWIIDRNNQLCIWEPRTNPNVMVGLRGNWINFIKLNFHLLFPMSWVIVYRLKTEILSPNPQEVGLGLSNHTLSMPCFILWLNFVSSEIKQMCIVYDQLTSQEFRLGKIVWLTVLEVAHFQDYYF